jgi:serine O-acetyltransferase
VIRNLVDVIAGDLAEAWPTVGRSRRAWYLLVDPGSRAVAMVRVQEHLADRALTPIASLIRSVNHAVSGLDWVTGARAGGGLVIRHPTGVVVGSGTVLGRGVTLMQGVTLGQRSVRNPLAHEPYPVLEDGVTVGAGATVLGGIRLGAGTMVGAHALVLTDTRNDSVMVGSPARDVSPAARSEERR